MKKLVFIFLILFSIQVTAQDKIEITEEDYGNTEVTMADKMRENGKIYVVVAVMAVIMGGIFTYMVFTDRKISRLEKELNA